VRERRGDIPLLVDHFIRKKSKELGIHAAPAMAPGALERLAAHPWPGNVRELENAVERALIRHRQGPLLFEPAAAPTAGGVPVLRLEEGVPPLSLEEVNRAYIEKVLALAGGRVNGEKGAAAMLGLHPNTLRNRMKRLGIAFGRRPRAGRPRA
jgi:DNA-binding NtrC family response regulator